MYLFCYQHLGGHLHSVIFRLLKIGHGVTWQSPQEAEARDQFTNPQPYKSFLEKTSYHEQNPVRGWGIYQARSMYRHHIDIKSEVVTMIIMTNLRGGTKSSIVHNSQTHLVLITVNCRRLCSVPCTFVFWSQQGHACIYEYRMWHQTSSLAAAYDLQA